MGVEIRKFSLKTAFTIPHRFQKLGVTTRNPFLRVDSQREWRNFGIAFFRFGIEIELFSSEKLENDTNFS